MLDYNQCKEIQEWSKSFSNQIDDLVTSINNKIYDEQNKWLKSKISNIEFFIENKDYSKDYKITHEKLIGYPNFIINQLYYKNQLIGGFMYKITEKEILFKGW